MYYGELCPPWSNLSVRLFCPVISKRLLDSSTDEDALRCTLIRAICELCPSGTAADCVAQWLDNSLYIGKDVRTAIRVLGSIGNETAIACLKKHLSLGFEGGEATGEKYLRSLATALASNGFTDDEIRRIAGSNEMHLGRRSADGTY